MSEFISLTGKILLKLNERNPLKKHVFMEEWRKEHSTVKGVNDGLTTLAQLKLIIVDDKCKCPHCGKIIPSILLTKEDVMLTITDTGRKYIEKLKEVEKVIKTVEDK